SMNANHLGGYFYYDQRSHGGNGRTWENIDFNCFRFSKIISYPAFFDCSLNGNPGTGDGANGDPYGSINGYLQWSDSIVDASSEWKIKLYLKDLPKINEETEAAPDSCFTGITPRQLQNFKPQTGTTLSWSITHS